MLDTARLLVPEKGEARGEIKGESEKQWEGECGSRPPVSPMSRYHPLECSPHWVGVSYVQRASSRDDPAVSPLFSL